MDIDFISFMQEEVPPNVYYAHYKNVEKSMVNGKFDPTAGLASSGIAGTAPEKDDEENKNTDEEMKDISKKDGGKLIVSWSSFAFNNVVYLDLFLLYSHAVDFQYSTSVVNDFCNDLFVCFFSFRFIFVIDLTSSTLCL